MTHQSYTILKCQSLGSDLALILNPWSFYHHKTTPRFPSEGYNSALSQEEASHRWAGDRMDRMVDLQEVRLLDSKTAPPLLIMIKYAYCIPVCCSREDSGREGRQRLSFSLLKQLSNLNTEGEQLNDSKKIPICFWKSFSSTKRSILAFE